VDGSAPCRSPAVWAHCGCRTGAFSMRVDFVHCQIGHLLVRFGC
jgi:hypothetical protein